MTQKFGSHHDRLKDDEYRAAYGEETARLEAAKLLTTTRKVTNVTQSALAQAAGVSQAYIGKLERGDANPTVARLGQLLGSIWMKIEMRPVPIDPNQSMESIITANSSPYLDDFQVVSWEGITSSTSTADEWRITAMD